MLEFFCRIWDKFLSKFRKICDYTCKIWNKSRKYVLFLVFSGIGTGFDWMLMKTLAPVIINPLTQMLILSSILSENVFQVLVPVVCNIEENIYAITNVISYPVGVAIAFLLSAKYAFKTPKEDMNKCVKDTIIVHITGYGLQELLLVILTVFICMDEDFAKLITIVVNGLLMLFSNIFIVFRDRDNTKTKVVTIVKFLPNIKFGRNKNRRKPHHKRFKRQKKGSGTWCLHQIQSTDTFFSYIEKSFFICLIQSSRNHVTLPM